MISDYLLDRVLAVAAVATGLLGAWYLSCDISINRLRGSVISVEDIVEKGKINTKTIIEGIVQRPSSRKPLTTQEFASVKDTAVFALHEVQSFNRSMGRMLSNTGIKEWISEFPIGLNRQVTVKMSENVIVMPLLESQKIIKYKLTWWENLVSIFSVSSPYFEKTSLRTIPIDHTIYVEGVLAKDPLNNFSVRASKIYTSIDELLSVYSRKRTITAVLLCLTGAILIVAGICKYYISKPHPRALTGGPPCPRCNKPSNILITRCNHLICNKCFHTTEKCPACLEFIEGYILLQEEL